MSNLDPFEVDSSNIVNQNRDEQDQYIAWDEGHIKDTTCQQKPLHSAPLGKQKEYPRNDGEKYCEFERVE